jgi:hypothetical protein
MKQVFTSADSAQVGLARSVLEAAKIRCEVREGASQTFPSVPFASELLVSDEDYEEATRLLAGNSGKS